MKFSKIITIVFLTIFDLFVFIFCGTFMMGYDDSYSETQGDYFSFSSMKMEHKIVWGFYNFWIVLNAVFLLYIMYKIYRKLALK